MATVTFEGGPADGKTLHFQRLPIFLRVVQGPKPEDLDVLDQLHDRPQPWETVSVYVQTSAAFVCRGPRGQDPRVATYRHCEGVVDSPELRRPVSWQRWAKEADPLSFVTRDEAPAETERA
jgi:hypothetical protein